MGTIRLCEQEVKLPLSIEILLVKLLFDVKTIMLDSQKNIIFNVISSS